MAHIVAEKTDGPRGVSSLNLAQRNAQSNLILLCFDHHWLIDANPKTFSVSKIRRYKKKHESWVQQRLSIGKPWTNNIQNLFYVNVPRLGILAAYLGNPIKLDEFFELTNLNSLGFKMVSFLLSYEQLLTRLQLIAIPLADLSINNAGIGTVCAFSGNFRTKNIGKALDQSWNGFKGDLTKDPHVYHNCSGYKLVLPIDLHWITTSSAGVHLASGCGNFSGLCLVNTIDNNKKIICASALVIGQTVTW